MSYLDAYGISLMRCFFVGATSSDNVSNESDWMPVGPIEVKAVTKYYTFGRQKVAMRRGDEVYYLHGDHLGSTSLTTDSAGAVVSEVRYHPYGQERWANGEAVTDFGFTSQRNEAGFGLMDYNARYYSPLLGRFVSPDTIVPDPSNGRGLNRYRYVRNNPLKYTDPSGHCIPGLCPGQNVEYYNSIMESSRGIDRYDAAIALNAALKDAPTRELWHSDSLRTAIANDAHLVAMKEGIYADQTWFWDEFLEEAAIGGAATAASISAGGDNLGPSATFSGKQDADFFSESGRVSLKPCSFSYDTLVMTREGLRPIGELVINDFVLAYDEITGETGWYPITALWVHVDPVIVYLIIEGEVIETTPNHPFYTVEDEWIFAGLLEAGDLIRKADSSYGVVQSLEFVHQPQKMYNLTVDVAHTYFVGEGQWLVHNDGCDDAVGKKLVIDMALVSVLIVQ